MKENDNGEVIEMKARLDRCSMIYHYILENEDSTLKVELNVLFKEREFEKCYMFVYAKGDHICTYEYNVGSAMIYYSIGEDSLPTPWLQEYVLGLKKILDKHDGQLPIKRKNK